MFHHIVIAGHGSQAVMVAGQILSYAGMLKGDQVSYFPAYCPEIPGGCASCSVVLSDAPITSAVVTKASGLLVMNVDALTAFSVNLDPRGLLVVNSSLIDVDALPRADAEHILIPANEIAQEFGFPRAASIALIGAYNALGTRIEDSLIKEAFLHVFGERKASLYERYQQIMNKGRDLALAQGKGRATQPVIV